MARPKQLGEGEVVTLTIRLPRDLRDAFTAKLLEDDQQASQVLRRAIRQYLAGGIPAAPTAPMPRPTPSNAPDSSPAPMWQAPSQPPVAPPTGERRFDGLMALFQEANTPNNEQDAEKHD